MNLLPLNVQSLIPSPAGHGHQPTYGPWVFEKALEHASDGRLAVITFSNQRWRK